MIAQASRFFQRASTVAARKPNQPAKLAAFISHAKADAKKAQEIAASLEERGLKCWIAPRDVTAGRTYGDEIIRGIESAKAFVLVLSKGSNGSAFVAREVERAVSKQKPIFVIRLANVEPAPTLELFISGTQWIDAFPGKLGPHIGKLAKLLGEGGGIEQAKPEQSDARTAPGKRPKWALPAGAAAALLLAVGVGFALWPDRSRVSNADPFLMTKPVWDDKQETQAPQQMAAAQVPEPALALKSKQQVEFEDETVEGALERPTGRALGLNSQGAPDADFRACEKASGDEGIAACDRAIASGKFSGRNLSYLHNDRGFLRMQKGELDQALVDLDEAIGIDASNFFAFWNRGAVYGAKSDFVRAQADFTQALALNPDETTKAKIVEALNAVTASAKAADAQSYDPSVISDPSTFGGDQEGSASAASSYPADAMPASPAAEPPTAPAFIP
jgi:tetratricopeptide (TPR) repeat protein